MGIHATVPVDAARAAAELARGLAAHPQPTLCADRLSVYDDSRDSEFERRPWRRRVER